MNYQFQSYNRTHDLAGKVMFINYQYSTDNKELAEFVRRNCKVNPHEIWEVTPEVLETATPEVKEEIKKRRQPKKTIVYQGMRTANAEGASA